MLKLVGTVERQGRSMGAGAVLSVLGDVASDTVVETAPGSHLHALGVPHMRLQHARLVAL